MTAPIQLAAILVRHDLTQAALAAHLGIARSTVNAWVNHGRAPGGIGTRTTRQGGRPSAPIDPTDVTAWLIEHGVPQEEASGWGRPTHQEEVAGVGAPAGSHPRKATHTQETIDMLLRRQPLHQATRRAFRLTCDPFARDLESHEDVFLSPDIRYVREAMLATARHGGLLAVVGESGSGKTTLLDDLEDRIAREGLPILLVRPDVTGMELSDTRGKVLRVGHIQEAVIHALAPDASLRQSPEARATQMRAALIGAREAGQVVCVAFDEAHAMPVSTLKHLKRLLEVKRGFTRLLSVILLGQPELGIRLSERNPEVREVVQRCEVVTLDPLTDHLSSYLGHKLAAAGRDLTDLITDDGMEALRLRLGIGAREQRPVAYPLLVGNLFAAALNVAAEIGQPQITAATVGRV